MPKGLKPVCSGIRTLQLDKPSPSQMITESREVRQTKHSLASSHWGSLELGLGRGGCARVKNSLTLEKESCSSESTRAVAELTLPDVNLVGW